jgi:aminoglycoside phosphotransferase family enzyme
MSNNLPEYIQFLLNEKPFSHPADEAKLIQTHISFVIPAGDFVYKFKKPVDFGFLDFTTLEKRKYFCEQELVLNRRLCPDIYRGLVTISRDNDKLSLNGAGEPEEYGIQMSRMPEEKMMGNIISAGQLTTKMLDDIVDVLAPFYQQADQAGAEFGTPEAVGVNVLENFDQTRDFVGSSALSQEQFEQISRYAKDFLTKADLFARRISQNKIRDCHGDLYSANICLADKVYIYDCIEFNERFRFIDVACDVAFMAMDLDFWGLEDLSRHFIKQFIAVSGDDLGGMLDFYKCYRAYVRGKIGLFTAGSPEVDEETKSLSMTQAGKYFQLALKYAAAN